MSDNTNLPPRFRAPSALTWVVLVGFAAFFIHGPERFELRCISGNFIFSPVQLFTGF